VTGPRLGGGLRDVLRLVAPRGLVYRDAQYLSATFEVDPKRMRPWLPSGMRLAEPARADLFCAYFPDNNFGLAYHEAGLFVHVKTIAGTGIHCPWMILDDDVPLILGREVAGYPKKLGEISWRLEGDEIEAHAQRRGTKLLSMTGKLGEVQTDAPPFIGRPHRNVIGLLGMALPRVVAFTPGEQPIEVRSAHLEVSFAGSDTDPLHQMGLGRQVEARLHRVNISAGRPPIPIRPLTPLFSTTHLRTRVL
jgi:acetoacetate decarboxylase